MEKEIGKARAHVAPAAALSPLNIPDHLDAKTTKKLLALRRRELKDLKQARYLDAAKEVGLGSVAAVIYSGGQIAKAGVDGMFDVIGKIAGNDNPFAQGVAVGGAIAVFTWFTEAFPDLSKKLRIDHLAFRLGLGPPSQTVNGTFLFQLKDKVTGKLSWNSYATAEERQKAMDYYNSFPHNLLFEVGVTQELVYPTLPPSKSLTANSVPTGAIGPFASIGAAAIALAVNGPYPGYVLVRVNGIIYIAPGPGPFP